ncbi:hypothetical protein DAPPUDRAFT_329694 [Daphnia pulex]|uniref:Uncharacterized protein n=1 Tax=Daphnia pulex TaxID=6669 RepID=E9HHC9_DAPPU|nr:hypothetical protein DAPPUDRAFT_329694 [Daphnia pulex]|eukprot:EFX68865.1 hypothetical protein DAPPUDRAFT_329694 [Daphnia pulex]
MGTPAVLPMYSGTQASQSMLTNTRIVLPRELRPLPQVPQKTPTGPRQRSNRRLGRTRILTDTPEKDLIEQEHKKMEEKKRKVSEKEYSKKGLENRRKKVSRELLPEKKGVATQKILNDDISEDDDFFVFPVTPSLCQRVSKTGLVIKQVNRTDL